MAFNAAVEEKLNELLDADGGISKRKVSINDVVFLVCQTQSSMCRQKFLCAFAF